ncbi:MAG: hypothetical protein KDC03_22590 [Flavobacteriales bacterium]|nr:hypothetical protein [Flavobacteriales bacterium]
MGFLESAVVVYLRALYYPDGFAFPLVPIDRTLVVTELGREVATMVMLLVPAALVTRHRLERFAWFSLLFGVWDLFYYIWLKVLLDWPESLHTWDLLFLWPIPSWGPVLAPCIVSVGLIALGIALLAFRSRWPEAKVAGSAWLLLSLAAVLQLLAFLEGPWSVLLGSGAPISSWLMEGVVLIQHAVPVAFAWSLFLAGSGVGLLGLLMILLQLRKGR